MSREKLEEFILLKSNSYSFFEKALQQKVFPGAAIGIVQGEKDARQTFIETYGFTSYEDDKKEVSATTFFDLASLSKPLATTLALLCLIKKENISLTSRLADIFKDREIAPDKKNITIRELLSHSAGFAAYRPYYEDLLLVAPPLRNKKLLTMLMAEPLEYEAGEKSIYSDLGYMLLGLVVERLSNKPLNIFVKEQVFAPLSLNSDIGYLTDLKYKKIDFAAAELCRVRQRILCGEVSDENCYALGGVAGHAGLFANINGVVKMAVLLLDQLKGRASHPNYLSADLQQCAKRREIKAGTWALGFDTPSPQGSTGGKYLSGQSIGHLGFTGTSFWIDPSRDLVMVLLSNRVHPSRDNQLIKDLRPKFHDLVIESLDLL